MMRSPMSSNKGGGNISLNRFLSVRGKIVLLILVSSAFCFLVRNHYNESNQQEVDHQESLHAALDSQLSELRKIRSGLAMELEARTKQIADSRGPAMLSQDHGFQHKVKGQKEEVGFVTKPLPDAQQAESMYTKVVAAMAKEAGVLYSPSSIARSDGEAGVRAEARVISEDADRIVQFAEAIQKVENSTSAQRKGNGEMVKRLTFDWAERRRNQSEAIMYPPQRERCEQAKRRVHAKDTLSSFLEMCLDSKKSHFMFDVCSVVKEYLVHDPLWELAHPDTHPDLHNHRDEGGTTSESGGRRTRNFLEVGGLDGAYHNSMTYIIEYFMDALWSGLTVEATPANFVGLIQNRPCTYRTEVALGSEWGYSDFYGWGGCCSGNKEGMSTKFKNKFHGTKPKSYPVRTAPFSSVVQAASMDRIHFLSLDVEGAEYFVVQGMNGVVKVDLMLVEATQVEKSRNLTEALISRGFVQDERFVSWNWMNELWIHAEDAESWMLDIYHKRELLPKPVKTLHKKRSPMKYRQPGKFKAKA